MNINARRFLDVSDIGVALALAVFGALAVAIFPDGSFPRLLFVAPVLFFAPGYLLLQAVLVPKRPPLTRVLHGVVSVGISLALVGLVALSAAVVRGGFRPAVIVILVTLTCVALAATGVYRRLYQPNRSQTSAATNPPRFRRPNFVMRPRSPPARPVQPAAKPVEPMPIVNATVAEPTPAERSTQATGPAVLQQETR